MITKLKKIPLLGKIAAGTPIEAISNYDNFIEIPTNYSLSNDSYALTVEGDSMIDEGILDGDVVIIDNKVEVKNGDIVVALIDKEEAPLKN
jgi:repressor LexA